MKKNLRSIILGIIFFFVSANSFGQTLQLLKDINNGPASSYPSNMIELTANQYLFFANVNTAATLWFTDGTPSGTRLVMSFADGTAGLYSTLTKLNATQAIFTSGYAVHDEELWVTDGTSEGTYLLHTFNPGINYNPAPQIGPVSNGKAFIKAMVGSTDAKDVWQLWATDGSITGTTLLADSVDAHSEETTAFNPSILLNNVLIFYAFNPKTLNYQVWRSDASKSGTYLLKNFGATAFEFSNMITLNDIALLDGYDNAHGGELWRSDGTVNGTRMLKDIVPGSQRSSPVYFTLLNQKVFFKTDGDTKLWETNGKANGTRQVPGVDPKATIQTITGVSGNKLYFVAWDQSGSIQLYRTKGNASGTVQLTNTSDKIFSVSYEFADVNGIAYFSMLTLRGGNITSSLYESDGSASGTIDIYDAAKNDNISELTAVSGSVYFIASDGSGVNRTLYSYSNADGAQSHDFFANHDDNASFLLVSGSSVFLSLNGADVGQEPYVYTPATDLQKTMVADNSVIIYPNPTDGDLNIQMPGSFSSENNATIVITDLSGRVVYNKIKSLAGGNSISIHVPESVSNGMFLLRIETKDESYTKMVDIQK